MAETPIGENVELVLTGLEQLALGLAADLARHDPDAATLLRARLEAAFDGKPRHPGAWFQLSDPGLMARLVTFADRLVRSAS